jgi:alkanesulfonate monooxygenase SsuD/methylene tetrahydromethanopterin reductase-like flavin-dependent oxidoreductase (luciferase family)
MPESTRRRRFHQPHGATESSSIGDEETVAAAIGSYFDAGATELVFTHTHLDGPESRLRTWKLLGELTGGSASAT